MSREVRTRMEPSAPLVLEQRLRDAVGRMSRKIDRGTPLAYRTWRADVTRSVPKSKPMGNYPDYAWECLRSGAPVSDVIAPLDELRDALIAAAAQRECIREAFREETQAEGHANEAQVEVAFAVESPSRSSLESWLERARIQRAKLDKAIHVGARMLLNFNHARAR